MRQFSEACMKNIKKIGWGTQLSRSDVFHLCMKVFQRLIEINYSKEEIEVQQRWSCQPKLFCYGGRASLRCRSWNFTLHWGSIVHLLKQKCLKVNQANTQTQLKILDCLLTHEMPSETATWKTPTQLFDRGGLSDIKHSVVGLLQLLEVKFI